MKNDRMIIVGLLLLSVTLLIGIIVMGYFVVRREHASKEKVIIKEVVSQQQVATAPTNLPIYPRQDPAYQTRRSVPPPEFQQIGTLTYDEGDEPIVLPLFGRLMPTRSDRWEYYTATDKQYMLKIPVMFENKDCLEEIGCREVYTKDTVFIPAYKKEFKVNLYKYRDNAYSPN